MANLLSVCELAWNQFSPKPGNEAAITKEEFIETGIIEAAKEIWLDVWNQRNADGYYEVPSYLLKQIEVPVKDNKADLSSFDILWGLPKDIWLQKIGDFLCDCQYVKNTVNLASLLCNEEDSGHNYRTVILMGKTMIFPKGVHEDPLKLIVASANINNPEEIEISPEIAATVRARLIEIYIGRTNSENTTNNSSSNT